MNLLIIACQMVIGLGLLNVWLLRSRNPTPYRGGDATNMVEEFAAYGLPAWMMWLTAALKVSLAVLLIAGVWIPATTQPAAALLAVLMFAAVIAHLKVGDPVKKFLPAASLLVLCLTVTAMTSSVAPTSPQSSGFNAERSASGMDDSKSMHRDDA